MSETKQGSNNKTPIYKKWWFWVIIVVVVLVVGGAGASSNKDPKKVGSDGSSQTSGDTSNSQSIFKVGDVIAIDNREMTVEKVQRNWTAEYSKPKDGKEYVMITVKLTNKGDEQISYTSGEWKMEDGDGAIESSTFVLGNDDVMSYGDLAAGGKKSGTLVFEVPKNDQNLKIHYQPNMFIDRKAIIEL